MWYPGAIPADFPLLPTRLRRARSEPGVPGVMAVVVLVWGLAFTVIQVLLDDLSALGLAGGRVVLCAVAFTLALPFVPPRPPSPSRRGDRWRLVLAGVLGLAVYNLGLAYGSQFASAGTVSIVVSTSPLAVALLARLLLGEPLGAQRAVGMGLALVGVALIVLGSGEGLDGRRLLGLLALAASPASWAAYTVIVKSIEARYDAVRLNAYGAWVAAVIGLPLMLSDWDAYRRLEVDEWLMLGYVAGVGGGVTVLLYSWSLRRWSAAGLASFMFIVPVAAVAWAWLLRGEAPDPGLLGGGALVLAGLVLVWRSRPVLGWLPALTSSLRHRVPHHVRRWTHGSGPTAG